MTNATTVRVPAGAEIARSWLLVNGGTAEAFGPASSSPADQVILDIEDAVDPKLKPAAREQVIAWLRTSSPTWVAHQRSLQRVLVG